MRHRACNHTGRVNGTKAVTINYPKGRAKFGRFPNSNYLKTLLQFAKEQRPTGTPYNRMRHIVSSFFLVLLIITGLVVRNIGKQKGVALESGATVPPVTDHSSYARLAPAIRAGGTPTASPTDTPERTETPEETPTPKETPTPTPTPS